MQAFQEFVERDRQRLQLVAAEYAQSLPIEIFSGCVTATGDRHLSTRVTTRQNTTLTVNTVPEIWMNDQAGQERRFLDPTFTECRAGHDLTLAIKDSDGAVLAMRNHTTGQTWFASELNANSVDAAHFLRIGFTVMFLILVIAVLASVIFGGAADRHPLLFKLAAYPVQFVGIVLGILIPERNRQKHNLKVEALRALIEKKFHYE